MSEQENANLVQGWLDAFGAADWAKLEASLAPDHLYVEHGTERRIEGASAVIDAFRGWKAAMPDVQAVVSKVVTGGDSVLVELTWEGTQTGPLATAAGEIPASGRKQVTPGVIAVDIENGKMKSSRNYFDMMSFLKQIGAM